MTDVYSGPYGSYSSVRTLASNGKADILANLVTLKGLIAAATPDDAGGRATAYPNSPDFDQIHPATAAKLIAEIDRIHLLTSLAPTCG